MQPPTTDRAEPSRLGAVSATACCAIANSRSEQVITADSERTAPVSGRSAARIGWSCDRAGQLRRATHSGIVNRWLTRGHHLGQLGMHDRVRPSSGCLRTSSRCCARVHCPLGLRCNLHLVLDELAGSNAARPAVDFRATVVANNRVAGHCAASSSLAWAGIVAEPADACRPPRHLPCRSPPPASTLALMTSDGAHPDFFAKTLRGRRLHTG